MKRPTITGQEIDDLRRLARAKLRNGRAVQLWDTVARLCDEYTAMQRAERQRRMRQGARQ